MIDQLLQNLILILLTTTESLLAISLHHHSPKEVSQVTIGKGVKIPPVTFIHTIIDGGGRWIGTGDDGVMSTGVGPLDIVRDGVAGTPVLVVEGGKLASHVGSGSWLSEKVDSKLPGPIAFLYT